VVIGIERCIPQQVFNSKRGSQVRVQRTPNIHARPAMVVNPPLLEAPRHHPSHRETGVNRSFRGPGMPGPTQPTMAAYEHQWR